MDFSDTSAYEFQVLMYMNFQNTSEHEFSNTYVFRTYDLRVTVSSAQLYDMFQFSALLHDMFQFP